MSGNVSSSTKNIAVTTVTESAWGRFLMRLLLAVGIIFLFALLARAGGPQHIAGTSYFAATMTGQPLVWPQGTITYYTDQGDLSPMLPNAAANAFVAAAFNQWTLVPTAAITASSGGQLAEDVNGTNVYVNSDGTITMPADIQPSATGTPVGVVYDEDGSVTDALLGAGAGAVSQCFTNAAYGGNDNFGTTATYQHALIVINGQCVQVSSQLVEVEYRLARVIGAVYGLGWSQLNLNVITGSPPPVAADFAGFPMMHDIDPTSCVPITRCYPNPLQLAMDVVSSISRLYPVTAQNQSGFPGKQISSSATASIQGAVWFTETSGNPTQPMQGVNVVARWIDPATGLPSRQYAASSVSGFLFTGDAGNPVTGFDDSLGIPYSQWGSNVQTVEGSFDLSGLQFPDGGSAQYQLTVEPLDPIWSAGVGPYAPYLDLPSGLAQPIIVTLTAGQTIQQDIMMSASALAVPPWSSSQTWTAPAAVPLSGDWVGSLSGYGDEAYFLLTVQANRTMSVAVTALDELGNPTETKSQPVIGIWGASDPEGTAPPSLTSSPFNTITFGLTRLDTQINTSATFVIGVSDLRGDGRPDYHYHANVLYADSVSPARVSDGGGAVTVLGTGFAPGLTATIGGVTATPLAIDTGQIILAAPPSSDGPQSITITNPASGASSTMTGVLTYGAEATDTLILLIGLNPNTPVGTQATNPVTVRVLAADGVTPVSGATIAWSATNSVQLSACSGASACSVLTDQSGDAATWLVPALPGVSTITATLAPGTYSAQSVNATLSAIEDASDIGVLTPYLWIAQGATVNIPLTARVLSSGAPVNNSGVNFTVMQGTGTLSAPSAQTNSTGYATATLSLTQIASLVQVSACVAPANAPCKTIYANAVPLSQLQLHPVSGAGQVTTNQTFQPVVVRVTDSSSPPNSVLAAPVSFQTTVWRPIGTPPAGGETNPGNPVTPVILAASQSTITSDINGLASVAPASGGFSAPLEVDVGITAGTSASLNDSLEVLPASPLTNNSDAGNRAPVGQPPAHVPGLAHRECEAQSD
jgi:hypothetical protein